MCNSFAAKIDSQTGRRVSLLVALCSIHFDSKVPPVIVTDATLYEHRKKKKKKNERKKHTPPMQQSKPNKSKAMQSKQHDDIIDSLAKKS